MELAIPLIALGGMYVISNQKNKSCKKNNILNENFSNMGKSQQNSDLPNTNIPSGNYPITNKKELLDTTQEYPNPNTATDKYFNQNLYEKKVNQGIRTGNNIQDIYSLSGNYLESEQFKHNNMVPFYGGKVKGYTYDIDIAETILDNMAGTGSQVIKKIEQAPLFKPEDDINWAYGMPNNSDFFQSRVNPVLKNNAVKPFFSENVGPGLNQGYTTEGSGGYNSGMEARDRWLDKTVDELRVDTNPKLEYTLENHEGPADACIKNRGFIGTVEKNRPDTFFINSQDRWLTTTGAEKGETLRPIQEMGIIRRSNEEMNYTGPAISTEKAGNYVPSAFEKSKRKDWEACQVSHSTAVGKGSSVEQGENIFNSYTTYTNNRSMLRQPDTMRSGFSAAVGAVIAPLMDILRPSRKEEVISNARIYGEPTSLIPSTYTNNPNEMLKTTNKETTLHNAHFYINNQKSAYVDSNSPLNETQRETSSVSYSGVAGGFSTQYGNVDYEAAYRQHNNDIKSQTIHNHPNQGNLNLFNSNINVSISKQDTNCNDNRFFTPKSIFAKPPALENYGEMRKPQLYDENINCTRIEPSILNAFRSNPYTQSLTTSV